MFIQEPDTVAHVSKLSTGKASLSYCEYWSSLPKSCFPSPSKQVRPCQYHQRELYRVFV